MKIIHIMMPDSLEGQFLGIYFDEKRRESEYDVGVPFDEWLHSYILKVLGEVAAREGQRLKEEAEAVKQGKRS